MADLKDTFSKGITTINVKASTFLESNKIKVYIGNLTQEIVQLKQEIGDQVYRKWCQTQNVSLTDLQVKLTEIWKKEAMIQEQSKLAAELAEKERQILGHPLQNGRNGGEAGTGYICSCCGEQYDTPVNYCRKCGTKLK